MRARTVTGLLMALAVLLTALAGCSSPAASPAPGQATSRTPASQPSATQSPQPAISPGSTGTVQLADRPFELHVPTGYDPARPGSLLVALHGYTSNGSEVFSFFGLAEASDSRDVLVALPQGTENPRGDRFWNASKACCDFYRSQVDDVAYLADVIATVQQQYAVDPARVYVVGHSNGGFMALRLACDRADVVAAVASLAGAMDVGTDCDPARPVSVLQVQGTADDTILAGGGQIDGDEYTSATETVELWRERDSCPAGKPSEGPELDADTNVSGDDLTTKTWSGCADGTEVALWSISDGSHVPALTADFTAALLDWFEANARR